MNIHRFSVETFSYTLTLHLTWHKWRERDVFYRNKVANRSKDCFGLYWSLKKCQLSGDNNYDNNFIDGFIFIHVIF